MKSAAPKWHRSVALERPGRGPRGRLIGISSLNTATGTTAGGDQIVVLPIETANERDCLVINDDSRI